MDNDAEKYAAMIEEDRQLSAEEGREPVVPEGQMDEADTIAQPGNYQERQPQYEPEPQYQQQIPHALEDPIGHFSARSAQLEAVAGHQLQQSEQQRLLTYVQNAERTADEELRGDYWPAVRHLEAHRVAELEKLIPDGQQGDMYARSHGLPNAAAARAAHLARDQQLVVQHAIANGQSPAEAYYRLAVERAGYRPQVDITRSEVARLTELSISDPKAFDSAWARYEKRARAQR